MVSQSFHSDSARVAVSGPPPPLNLPLPLPPDIALGEGDERFHRVSGSTGASRSGDSSTRWVEVTSRPRAVRLPSTATSSWLSCTRTVRVVLVPSLKHHAAYGQMSRSSTFPVSVTTACMVISPSACGPRRDIVTGAGVPAPRPLRGRSPCRRAREGPNRLVELELRGTADGRPTAAHAQLLVDVRDVRLRGVQRD